MKGLLAYLLSLIFLINQSGVGVSTHFCGGKAVKKGFSYLAWQPECDMEKAIAPSCKNSFQDKCCDDETLLFTFEVHTSLNEVISLSAVKKIISNVPVIDILHEIVFSDTNPPLPHVSKESPPLFSPSSFFSLIQVFRL